MDTVLYDYTYDVIGARTAARCMTYFLCKDIRQYVYDDSDLVPAFTLPATHVYDYDDKGMSFSAIDTGIADSRSHSLTWHTDAETHLHYCGYRYYSAKLGRWPNRDPIGEDGGANLYGFVLNTPVNMTDAYGEIYQAAVWKPIIDWIIKKVGKKGKKKGISLTGANPLDPWPVGSPDPVATCTLSVQEKDPSDPCLLVCHYSCIAFPGIHWFEMHTQDVDDSEGMCFASYQVFNPDLVPYPPDYIID